MADLTIDGETFRVEVEGDTAKPALLLSNSLGTDLSLWDGQMPALTEHFRVVRYDARGHGGSVANEGPYSIDRLGRDALAILDALEIDTAHVMGVSMGGAVAQWLMIKAPERIGRAVLANTTARFMNPEIWNTRIAAVLRGGMDESAAATIERWFSPEFRDAAPDRVQSVHETLRKTPPHGYAACGAALRDMDLTEQIRSVTHPVLVVTGADDPAISAEDTACFLDAIADSRHVSFETRHISNIEAQQAFTDAVVAFLTARTPTKRTRRNAGPTGAARPSRTPTASARRSVRRSIGARDPLPKITSAKAARGQAAKAPKTVAMKAQPRARASKAEQAPVPRRPVSAKATNKTPSVPAAKLKRPSQKMARTSTSPRVSASKVSIGKMPRERTQTATPRAKATATKATATKATATRATATKPGKTKPGKTNPGKTNPGKTKPNKAKPMNAKPSKARSATIPSVKIEAAGTRSAHKASTGRSMTTKPSRPGAASLRKAAAVRKGTQGTTNGAATPRKTAAKTPTKKPPGKTAAPKTGARKASKDPVAGSARGADKGRSVPTGKRR